MAKSENIIRILKLPSDAFNKRRPVSDLLWTQVEHLAAVVKGMIDTERRAITTEEEASAFIRKYTAFLHQPAADKKPAAAPNGTRKKAARSSDNGVGKKAARPSGKGTMKKTPRSSKR
jgi:hypothetical protein